MERGRLTKEKNGANLGENSLSAMLLVVRMIHSRDSQTDGMRKEKSNNPTTEMRNTSGRETLCRLEQGGREGERERVSDVEAEGKHAWIRGD